MYMLCLPNNPKTFLEFHSSLLKPFIPNNQLVFSNRELLNPGIVVIKDSSEEVLVDKIVDERKRRRRCQYKVHWIGYRKEHNEWLLCLELLNNEALDV